MRSQREQVLNTIEIIKDNNRQWEIAKTREVECGMMTQERFNELRTETVDASARHIKQLEELLNFK